MKIKKTKNKKIIVILIFIIILITIAIILINFIKNNNPLNIAIKELNYILDEDSWRDETIYPNGSAALGRAYQGNLTIMSIGKSMYYVTTDFLPNQYEKLKDMSEEKLSKYYNKNSELIQVAIGIDKESKFIDLINGLKALNADTLELESYYIDVDLIKTANAYTTAKLYITYKGCSEILLNVKINNKIDSDTSSIIYTIDK
jgi:hypothetical protein